MTEKFIQFLENFSSETLEELDIGIRELFMEHGGKQLKVINCLNDDEQWIQGLEQLVLKEFETVSA